MRIKRHSSSVKSDKSTSLLLSVILATVILGSFTFFQTGIFNHQTDVKGLATTSLSSFGHNFGFFGIPSGTPSVTATPNNGYSPKLSCDSCARLLKNVNPYLCLNTTDKTPFAHCSSGNLTSETCAICPPVPTAPACQKICPQFLCRIDPITNKKTCPSNCCEGSTPAPLVTGTSCKPTCTRPLTCNFGQDCKVICVVPAGCPVIDNTSLEESFLQKN